MSRLSDGDGSTEVPPEPLPSRILELLGASEVFGSLSRSDIADLVPYVEVMHVGAGETVVRQGDPADALYLVAVGRLEIVVTGDGGHRLLAEIGPGELIGEAALLTQGVRSASAHCVRDSVLLRLSGSHFRSYVHTHPDALLSLADRLITRVARANEGRPPTRRVRTVALVPAGVAAPRLDDLARELTESLAAFGPTLRVDSDVVDSVLDHASGTQLGDPGNNDLVRWLHEIEEQHAFVVYEAHDTPSAWTQRCLRQADRVLLVGRAGTDPRPGPIEATLLASDAPAGRASCELVLLRTSHAVPRGTLGWLERRSVRAHHHLRTGHRGDCQRLARSLAGEAIGVVLSGGGARGAVHLGVLHALDQSGVPVDVVGGSSIGAIMGATYAMGWDHALRTQVIRDGYGAGWVREATLPLVSLLRGRGLNNTLQTAFGETRIEDMPIPFLCVSTNLSRGEVVLHTVGPVWRAARASSSIPGVFSPICDGGDLLVDGGVLSHMPVQPIRERVGEGRIVAVDLRKDVELHVAEDFGPSLSGWHVLKERLVTGSRGGARPPSIGALLLRAAELGTALEDRRSAAGIVDLRLRPPTGRYGLMDFNTPAANALFEAGYEYAMAELQRTGMAGLLTRPRQYRRD
ncbi:MAG: patatin-like phospholipase family protein [Acidimicrobiia bacterium]